MPMAYRSCENSEQTVVNFVKFLKIFAKLLRQILTENTVNSLYWENGQPLDIHPDCEAITLARNYIDGTQFSDHLVEPSSRCSFPVRVTALSYRKTILEWTHS